VAAEEPLVTGYALRWTLEEQLLARIDSTRSTGQIYDMSTPRQVDKVTCRDDGILAFSIKYIETTAGRSEYRLSYDMWLSSLSFALAFPKRDGGRLWWARSPLLHESHNAEDTGSIRWRHSRVHFYEYAEMNPLSY
jgi:hypothetical protein